MASLVACACSGGSTTSSSSGGGLSETCGFTGEMSGGLAAKIDATACSTSTSAQFSVSQADLSAGTSIGVTFSLDKALVGRETGPVALTELQVFQIEKRGQDPLVWTSASCTLTLEKNEPSPTSVFKNRFLLAGRGTCSAALTPKAPNTKPTVAVTPFEVRAFVDPR
jgi:hypothetical protein